MGLHCIDEEFEYFEENVVREDFDCDLLKLAYIILSNHSAEGLAVGNSQLPWLHFSFEECIMPCIELEPVRMGIKDLEVLRGESLVEWPLS
jgi:hypothetical protein